MNAEGILKEVELRGITQVVHFTTMRGAVGILASKAVKSRARLEEDKFLEHVYMPNVNLRKDKLWLDYVNLSIERINDWMFGSSRWHHGDDNPWVVFSFDPIILTHEDVVFATTNNIYPACQREEGLAGLRGLFAEETLGRYNTIHNRRDKLQSWPTDRQAEVLYPGELSCDHLQRIDVLREESLDVVAGILGALQMEVPTRYAPEVFV